MKSYKIKKKKKKISTLAILIMLIILLISTGVGYSLWYSNLYVIGNVTTNYKEPKLENIEFVKQSSNYISIENGFSIGSTFSISSSSTFDDDTVGVTGVISLPSRLWWNKSVTVTMQFTNNTNYSFTDGKIEILENENQVSADTPTITETVDSKGTSTVTVKLTATSSTKTSNIKYRFSYRVNDVIRYGYLNIQLK